jgi:hypothetical protein
MDGSGGITPALEYVMGALQLVVVTGLWLFSDNAQSPLIGVIIGIWAGMNARRTPEAAGIAAALYGALQLTLLVGAAYVWTIGTGVAEGPRLGAIITVVIISREVILRALWSALRRHLNASGAELAAVLRL